MLKASRFLSALVLLAAVNTATANDGFIEIRGFQVDVGELTERQLNTVRRSLEKQFEIIEEANVPQNVLDFFRSIRIVVSPRIMDLETSGVYQGNSKPPAVVLKPIVLPFDRPIVLHELLHAYHHQVIKQPTPQVGRAYTHALREGIYPRRYHDAHFMENGGEYFAVIASIYLYGKRIDQPPYDCSITAKHQPDFIAFLAKHFGERPCR